MQDAGYLTESDASLSEYRYRLLYDRLRRGHAGLEEFFRLKADIFASWYRHSQRADSIIGLRDIALDAMRHGLVLSDEPDIYRRLNEENDHAIAGLNWAGKNGMALYVSFGFIRTSGLGGRGMILFTEFPNESREFREPGRYVEFCEYVLKNSGSSSDLRLYGKE